jgi:phosphoesterase RecJ-like protein
MKNEIKILRDIITKYSTFLLTTHVNPDADALGSELALARLLRKLGKQTTILNYNKTPDHLEWMDNEKQIIHFDAERDKEKILRSEVILVIDTNQPYRVRTMEPFVLQSKAIKVVIDHHLESDPFSQHYVVDTDATSTGEIVYRIVQLYGEKYFDQTIARMLYAAIMTDTGSFRFPRTDPEIHHIAAFLIEQGADPTEIYSNIFETWSPNRMRLLGEVLDTMKTAYDGKLAYIVCTHEMFQRTETSEVETDNFSTYPMSVKGVLVGMLFNELPNGVKISFRSKGTLPANEMAKELGGNGHLNAAGVRLYNVKLGDVIEKAVKIVEKYLP